MSDRKMDCDACGRHLRIRLEPPTDDEPCCLFAPCSRCGEAAGVYCRDCIGAVSDLLCDDCREALSLPPIDHRRGRQPDRYQFRECLYCHVERQCLPLHCACGERLVAWHCQDCLEDHQDDHPWFADCCGRAGLSPHPDDKGDTE